jgi:hypothetical protein
LNVAFESSRDRGKFDCTAVQLPTDSYVRHLVPEIDEQVKEACGNDV